MKVTATVPATSANLGPGFDCLGLALALHNQVTFETVESGVVIEIEGEGQKHLPRDSQNLVLQAAERVFSLTGRRPPGLQITQKNAVPVGSGLGSSAAAVLAGLAGANAIVNGGLSLEELLALAVEIEGHPDNVVPAATGGLALVVSAGDRLHFEQIPLPMHEVVVVLPDFELSTAAARAALPGQVPLTDAVFNLGRTALLVTALMRGDWSILDVAMEDRLHQRYRLPLIPGAVAALEAARSAGAQGVALSGAGPSLLAFAENDHAKVGEAMQIAFGEAGLTSRVWVLQMDTRGLHVVVSG